MRIELCSVWEGFDGSRFEVIDMDKESVVLRSLNEDRRINLPVWKFEAGMLSGVKYGRKRLYAPSDVQIGRALLSLDHTRLIRPESKCKRKNRYLCRTTTPDTYVSYKHLTPRKICTLLNTEVDHIVDGDLRPGVEFKNGIRIERRHENIVRFSVPCGCHFVSNVETFLELINAK